MDPTVAQLLRQRAAAGFPTPFRRRQRLPAPIRELHRRVLAHFAATGQPPRSTILAAWAIELGVGLQDALGIPAMLDQDAAISSHDPLTGEPITVEVHDGHARWKPAPVVVGYSTQSHGPTRDAGTMGQAACCRCPLIDFHVSAATAQAWQQREGVRLELLAIPQALQFAAAVFGDLLRSPDSDDQDPTAAAATAPWTIAGRGDPPTP